MSVATYTKSGTKASVAAKLDKDIFGLTVADHTLVKTAYIAYLANRRSAAATTKTRGLVRGGGIKPWRQKGTGRARVGSIRSPIWRGGGITFGPIGNQNYSHYLTPAIKSLALRQSLSLSQEAGRISVIEEIDSKSAKTKDLVSLLAKINATGSVTLVVTSKDDNLTRMARNASGVRIVTAAQLTTYDVMNADNLVLVGDAARIIADRLAAAAAKKTSKKEAAK